MRDAIALRRLPHSALDWRRAAILKYQKLSLRARCYSAAPLVSLHATLAPRRVFSDFKIFAYVRDAIELRRLSHFALNWRRAAILKF